MRRLSRSAGWNTSLAIGMFVKATIGASGSETVSWTEGCDKVYKMVKGSKATCKTGLIFSGPIRKDAQDNLLLTYQPETLKLNRHDAEALAKMQTPFAKFKGEYYYIHSSQIGFAERFLELVEETKTSPKVPCLLATDVMDARLFSKCRLVLNNREFLTLSF
jgi:hypothetical protein